MTSTQGTRLATVTLLLSMLAGCNSTASHPLVGKWACRDLSMIGHKPANAVGLAAEFRANGTSDWYYIDDDGGRELRAVPEDDSHWTADKDSLRIGDAPPAKYQITGSTMRMTQVDDDGDVVTFVFDRE